jgi:hypothetical protein
LTTRQLPLLLWQTNAGAFLNRCTEWLVNDLFSYRNIKERRARIIKELAKTNATFLVVEGIMHTTLRYPEHKFLLGGVY